MKKSKKYSSKGSGRLSKKDFDNMKGHKKNHDFIKKDLDWKERYNDMIEDIKLEKKYSFKPEHSWNHKNITFSIESYNCCNSGCGVSGKCSNEISHMFGETSYNIDWSKLTDNELIKLNEMFYTKRRTRLDDYINNPNYIVGGYTKEEWINHEGNILEKYKDDDLYFVKKNMWIRIYFTCKKHIYSSLSSVFYMGSRLHFHYVKSDTNAWGHFHDKYLYPNECKQIEYNNIYENSEFILTEKNYKKVLREKSDLLIKKRNFSFYYDEQSWRQTGFCTFCESKFEECNEYTNINNRGGICDCGHSKKSHYFDDEWDELKPYKITQSY